MTIEITCFDGSSQIQGKTNSKSACTTARGVCVQLGPVFAYYAQILKLFGKSKLDNAADKVNNLFSAPGEIIVGI